MKLKHYLILLAAAGTLATALLVGSVQLVHRAMPLPADALPDSQSSFDVGRHPLPPDDFLPEVFDDSSGLAKAMDLSAQRTAVVYTANTLAKPN